MMNVKKIISLIMLLFMLLPLVYLANLHTSFLCNLIYPTFSRILLYSC